MMSHVGQPEVFQPDRFRKWLAHALTVRGVVCHRVGFEPTGRLMLEFRGTLGEHSLWLVSRAEDPLERLAECRPGLIVSASADHGRGDPMPLARFVATRLDRLVERFRVPLLDLFRPNRPERPLTFGPGLFAERISPFLVPGRTRWGRFLFSGENFRDGGLLYRFESAGAAVEILVVLDPHAEGAVFATRHLSGLLVLDERTVEEASVEEFQVERYIGFLLSLCDTPGSRYERPTRHRSVVADATLDWGSRLDTQFFLDEPGHDFLGVFYFLYGIRGPVAAVVHSERECGHMAVWDPVPYTSGMPSTLSVRPPPDLPERVFLTDLGEGDAIMGGEGRLQAAIAQAGSLAGVEMVLVAETCLVRVVGDDVSGCIEAVRPCSKCPLVDMDVARKDANRQFLSVQSSWVAILEHRADRSLPREERSVNLIGYGPKDSQAVCELISLLAALGIKVNACLFPALDWEEARRFETASLNIVSPWTYIQQAFRLVQEWSRVPSLTLPLPWGIEGTRAWLRAVGEAVTGVPPSSVPEPRLEDLARFERLREEASCHPVGFVVLSTQWHSLLDPARSYGANFPALLNEMGFPLLVLYFDPPEARHAPSRMDPQAFARRLEAAATGSGRASVVVFERADELSRLLSEVSLDLVYSEMRQDPRARAAGLETFCITDLSMGYQGAVVTLERLVRRSRNPFRKRYAKWLVPC